MGRRSLFRLMIWGSYRRPVLKIALLTLFVILWFMVSISVALQVPKIQTQVTQIVAAYLSKKTGTPITVESVNINWFSHLTLYNVTVKDEVGANLITSEKVKVSFSWRSLRKGKETRLKKVVFENAIVKVIRNEKDQDFNITYFVNNIKKLKNLDNQDSIPSLIEISTFELINSTFIVADPFKDTITGKFNHNQFQLVNINAKAENLVSIDKTFSIDIHDLSLTDSVTNLRISKLSGTFKFTPTTMVFQNFDFEAGTSHLNASMVFSYDSIGQMREFVDQVNIIADFKDSEIYTNDLALFAPGVQKIRERFIIKGLFQGLIKRFTVKNIEFGVGEDSNFKGAISFDGLPDFENTFIDVKIENAFINPDDFSNYFNDQLSEKLTKFGRTKFSGRFTGFPVDFVADGLFITEIGRIDSDINLKIDPKPDLSRYSGNMIIRDLDIGILLDNNKIYQHMDLSGNVTGSGLSFETADFYLKADIDTLGVLGYNYSNIKTDGHFTSKIFNGLLSIDDPNLTFTANAAIDLNKDKESIEVYATLDTAILHQINLSEKEAGLSFTIGIDMQGFSIDEMNGQIDAQDAYLFYDGDAIEIKNFNLYSSESDSLREFHVSTDDFSLDANGVFDFSVLFKDIPRIIKEYKLIIINDYDSLHQYFAKTEKPGYKDYALDYELNLYNINPVLKLFVPDLNVSRNILLKGHLGGGSVSDFRLTSHMDTIQYNSNYYINADFQVKAIHLYDTTSVQADIFARIDEQIRTTGKGVQNVYLRSNWNNRKLKFEINAEQKDSDSRANVFGTVNLLKDTTEISIQPSIFKLFGDRWSFSKDNALIMSKNEIEFQNIRFYFNDQSIRIDGSLSRNPDEELFIQLDDVQLENLNLLLSRNIFGKLNGQISIQDYYNETFINSDLDIADFVFVKFEVGDIKITSNWEDRKKRMTIETNVIGDNDTRTIDLSGFYYPANVTNKFDLIAEFDNANLNVIEPFYSNFISDLRGSAKGELHIGGNFQYPIVEGEAFVSNGNVKIDYINTTYTFEGKVGFTENEIGFRDMQLYDVFNNTGELNGGIQHNGFKNVRFDLKGSLNKLMALNTSSRDNSLYYGTAFGTGTIEITGQGKNINFRINATTESGTKIFIPLSGTSEAGQEEYIEFYNPETAVLTAKIEEQLNLSGVRLDFDLEITPEAYCEIIFDIQAGDIIRGRGNGKLNMQIDTKGEFLMFGDFEIAEGGYNFTLYNLINKEFKVQPNSLITWSGDPYSANLDLTAYYNQNASLSPLMNTQDSAVLNHPDIRRKYPTDVILYLKGPLMSPEIDFDIKVEDYPKNVMVNGISLETTVSAFETTIHSDEQEMKRQVFSLIILRRFSEMGAFSVSGYSFGSSVSEFISNQLSYWITQFDENLVVEVDLGSLDENAFNTFQLRLSYTFMDGRLRVTRAGNVDTGEYSSDLSNIVGDWTVEYLLTTDGKYRVKMYNRFDNNYYNSLLYQKNATTTAGFSLMHTQSFDELKDLFRRARNKNRKKGESEYIQYEEGVIPSSQEEEKDEDSDMTSTDEIKG